MNSGDWIENLTCLEYHNNEWNIYHYDDKKFASEPAANIEKKLPVLNVVTDEVQLFTHFEGLAANGLQFTSLFKKMPAGI